MEMGRCGTVALFAVALLFSVTTGDVSSSVRRRDGVSDAPPPETSDSDQSLENYTSRAEPPATTPAENFTLSRNLTDGGNDSATVTPATPPLTPPHSPTTPASTVAGVTTPSNALAPESASAQTNPASSSSTSLTASTAQMRARADTPSALNVSDDDDDLKVSTDPLLAGLVSAFIVIAAIVSVLVFLKFRQTSEGPEFHRLQDVPMDDMLEEAPLSMYSY